MNTNDEALRTALKKYRIQAAGPLPAYCVFKDAAVDAMVAKRPRDTNTLILCNYVGAKTVKNHGQALLSIIAAHTLGAGPVPEVEVLPAPLANAHTAWTSEDLDLLKSMERLNISAKQSAKLAAAKLGRSSLAVQMKRVDI